MADRPFQLAFKSHDTDGTLYVNTLGCVAQYDADPPSAQAVADGAAGHFATHYLECLPEMLVLDEITARRLDVIPGETGAHAVGSTGILTGLDGHLPKEVSLIVSWRTAHPGRSGRGHIALPSPRESGMMSSAGNWSTSSGYWGFVGTFCNDYLAGWTDDFGNDYIPAVWSRKDHAAYPVTSFLRRTAPRWVERRQTAP